MAGSNSTPFFIYLLLKLVEFESVLLFCAYWPGRRIVFIFSPCSLINTSGAGKEINFINCLHVGRQQVDIQLRHLPDSVSVILKDLVNLFSSPDPEGSPECSVRLLPAVCHTARARILK